MKKVQNMDVYEHHYGDNEKMITYDGNNFTVWNRERGCGNNRLVVTINWAALGGVDIKTAEQFLFGLTVAIRKAKQWEKENKRRGLA